MAAVILASQTLKQRQYGPLPTREQMLYPHWTILSAHHPREVNVSGPVYGC